MGASRDLTISVFVEATLVLACRLGAGRGTTDLRGVIAGTAGTEVWTSPALALAAVTFVLVVVAETGRQPVDNPDTHLELTMIHEGPLLEYAGRDLAYLRGRRLRATGLCSCLRRRCSCPIRRRVAAAWLPLLLVVMRGARPDRDARGQDADPARSATALDRCGAALLGVVAWLVEATSGAITWMLVALGLGVVVVRRRSVAVALVSVQALRWPPSPPRRRRAATRWLTAAALAARAASPCSCCSSSRARASCVCARGSPRSRARASPSRSRSR